MNGLEAFVRESNAIEGIQRDPTEAEIAAHAAFLNLEEINIPDLERFVDVVQPGAKLRSRAGMNVRIGLHVPLAGGPKVEEKLQEILDASELAWSQAQRHAHYMTLHPFMDGNGRSGRVLWLYDMGGIAGLWRKRATSAVPEEEGEKPVPAPMGFLETFYRQTLQIHDHMPWL